MTERVRSIRPIELAPANTSNTKRDADRMDIPCVKAKKEWVIPPRPKPGRKAAVDIPPTKRKQQNRAAQRAFRERRAARVSELEEQLKQCESEKEDIRESLINENNSLQKEVEILRQEIVQLREALTNINTNNNNNNNNININDHTRQRMMKRKASDAGLSQSSASSASSIGEQAEQSCGLCVLADAGSGNCVCEHVGLRMQKNPGLSTSSTASSAFSDLDRLPSQLTSMISKSSNGKQLPPPTEIDFTYAFKTENKLNSLNSLNSIDTLDSPGANSLNNQPFESCGFCTNGVGCICRDSGFFNTDSPTVTFDKANNEKNTPSNANFDVEGKKIKLPVVEVGELQTASSRPCQPGSCTKCVSDPNCTLFCQALASRSDNDKEGTCCGGSSKGGFCCKETDKDKTKKDPDSTYLPCSAVYQTLSRHRGYDKANINSLVDSLSRGSVGMMFETSRVRDTLRLLDRAVGRGD